MISQFLSDIIHEFSGIICVVFFCFLADDTRHLLRPTTTTHIVYTHADESRHKVCLAT